MEMLCPKRGLRKRGGKNVRFASSVTTPKPASSKQPTVKYTPKTKVVQVAEQSENVTRADDTILDNRTRQRPAHEVQDRLVPNLNRQEPHVELSHNLTTLDEQGPSGSSEIELRQSPEYEMAWEFEMWRHAEEAKWRAEMQEREAARMVILEGEWFRRDKERMSEIQRMRAENAHLEEKLRANLNKLEKRERAVVLAEEKAAIKRETLDRECAQHGVDAQVAVKRLKAECEFRVELERTKYAALEDLHRSLEERFANVNASLVQLEKTFADYKKSQQCTSESELTAQLIAVKQKFTDLQRKLDIAVQTRNRYKAQMLRMARELASLYNKRMEEEARIRVQERDRKEIQAVAALIKSHALRAQEERQEIAELKRQLEQLQTSEQYTGIVKTADVKDERMDRTISQTHPASEIQQVQAPRAVRTSVRQIITKLSPEVERDNCQAAKVSTQTREDNVKCPQTREQHKVHSNGRSSAFISGLNLPAQEPHTSRRDHKSSESGAMGNILATGKFHTEYDAKNVASMQSSSKQLMSKKQREIQRLSQQKSDLLLSGVYTPNDQLIIVLEHQIAKLTEQVNEASQ